MIRRLVAGAAAACLALVLAIAETIRIALIPRDVVREDPYALLPVMPPTDDELAVSRETRRGT